ncbi:unnamed protein product [Boreogadus saida]
MAGTAPDTATTLKTPETPGFKELKGPASADSVDSQANICGPSLDGVRRRREAPAHPIALDSAALKPQDRDALEENRRTRKEPLYSSCGSGTVQEENRRTRKEPLYSSCGSGTALEENRRTRKEPLYSSCGSGAVQGI